MGNQIKKGFEHGFHQIDHGFHHFGSMTSHFASNSFSHISHFARDSFHSAVHVGAHAWHSVAHSVSHGAAHLGGQVAHTFSSAWHSTASGFNKYVKDPVSSFGNAAIKTVSRTVSGFFSPPPVRAVRRAPARPQHVTPPNELAYRKEQAPTVTSTTIYLALAGTAAVVYLIL